MAWLGEVEKLPIYGSGANVVPTVHVNDLAGYVCFMIFNFFFMHNTTNMPTLFVPILFFSIAYACVFS